MVLGAAAELAIHADVRLAHSSNVRLILAILPLQSLPSEVMVVVAFVKFVK